MARIGLRHTTLHHNLHRLAPLDRFQKQSVCYRTDQRFFTANIHNDITAHQACAGRWRFRHHHADSRCIRTKKPVRR